MTNPPPSPLVERLNGLKNVPDWERGDDWHKRCDDALRDAAAEIARMEAKNKLCYGCGVVPSGPVREIVLCSKCRAALARKEADRG